MHLVLGFFVILIASNGSTNMERELRVINIVNSISMGGKAVENLDFVGFEGRAGIVNWDDLQNVIVDRVTFPKGYIYFGVVMMDIVICKRGNNKIAGKGLGMGTL
jgi:hypothetical protein